MFVSCARKEQVERTDKYSSKRCPVAFSMTNPRISELQPYETGIQNNQYSLKCQNDHGQLTIRSGFIFKGYTRQSSLYA